MSTHAQRIEAVSEMYENGAAENRLRAALNSVQAERYRLENRLAEALQFIDTLQDVIEEMKAAGAGTAADEPTRGSPAPSLETAPASVATS